MQLLLRIIPKRLKSTEPQKSARFSHRNRKYSKREEKKGRIPFFIHHPSSAPRTTTAPSSPPKKKKPKKREEKINIRSVIQAKEEEKEQKKQVNQTYHTALARYSFDIGARAEEPARARQHGEDGVGMGIEGTQRGDDVGDEGAAKGVELGGAVEGDGADAVVDGEGDVGVGGHYGGV